MASNEIVFKIKVEKDGNLTVVAKEAEKAAKNTDKLGKSTDKLEKSRSRYHKAEKGVGQAGLSSSKSFSKMRQTMGGGSSGLVGAYAVLAANIFALTAAFGALQKAAQFKQLEGGLQAMGSASGVALLTLSKGLREATGNALNLEDAMRATALASSAGFDSSSIERLGDVARKASIALGRDTADSLNRLTKGAIKLEPELLDELGIMVRLDEASQAYATALNKNVADLTNFEKRQGFMNAVLEEGERKFAAMGEVNTNAYDQLAATFNDLTKALLTFLNTGLIPFISIFANSQMAMLGGLILFGKTIASAMLPALAGLGGGYEKAAKAARLSALQQVNQLKLFKGGTKGMQTFIKEFDPLTAKQKDFNKIQQTANGQLTRNTNQLKKWSNNTKKTVEQLAQKTALVKANQIAVNEAGLANWNFSRSEMAAGDSAAMAAAGQGNYREAIDKLSVQLGLYDGNAERAKKGTKGFGKAQITLSNIMAKTALRAKVLGTAFLNMIPIIGQVILVLGILWSVFKKVMDMMRSDEQKQYIERLSKLKSSMEEWGESLQQVSNYQQGLTSTLSSVTQEMEALTNVYTSMAAGIKGLGEEDLTGWDKFMMMFSDSAAQEGLQFIVKTQPQVIDRVKELAAAAGVGADGVEKLTVEFFKLGTMNHKYSSIILPKLLAEIVKAPAAINTMNKSVKEGNKAFDEFANSTQMKTSVDAVVAAMADIDKSMLEFGESSGEKWVEGYKQNVGDNLSKVIGLDELIAKHTKYNSATGVTVIVWERIRREIKAAQGGLSGMLKEQQRQERVLKGENKMLKANSKLQQFMKEVSGSALKIAKNKESLRVNDVKQLEIEIQNHIIANALGEDEIDNNKVIVDLRKQIEDSNARKLTAEGEALVTAKENLAIEQKTQQAQAAINDGIQRGIDLLKKSASARETIALNAARQENRDNPANRGKGELSAAQTYKKLYQEVGKDGKTFDENKIAAVNEEAELKTTMIEMEYTLLKYRLEVIKADMINTAQKANKKAETGGIDALIGQIDDKGPDGLIERAKSVIELERQASLSVIAEARGKALEDVQTQLRTGTGVGVGSSGEAAGVLKTGTGEIDEDANAPPGTVDTGNSVDITFLDKVDMMKAGMTDLMEMAGKLGPEGEVVAAVSQGAMAIADSWGSVSTAIEGGAVGMERGAVTAQAVANTIGVVADMMAKSSAAKVAGIDKEIAAEQKRDGKSKASVAKIRALEAKKEAAKKKAFNQNKKMMMAQTVASTAAAIMQSFHNAGGYPLGMGMAIAMGAIGAANLAIIAGSSYEGGGGGTPATSGPSSVSVGERGKS